MTRKVPAPPQNMEAEESVLGAMLMSGFAVEAAVEEVRPSDFYRPSHATMFSTVAAMHDDGEPVDAVTLAARLEQDGKLKACGGPARIHELALLVPTTANVRHYCQIVRELAVRRSLIETGEKIARLGWDEPGEAQGLIERAESAALDLAGQRSTFDFAYPKDTVNATVTRIQEMHDQGTGLVGLPSGYTDLDEMTAGFANGNLIIIAGRPSMGKGQKPDAPVLTPTGWRRIGDLQVNDVVIGADGRPDTVTGIYDRGILDFYAVTLADGTRVECSTDHLWLTRTRNERRAGNSGKARTADEIRATLCRGDGRGNHSIPYVGAVEFAPLAEALPADPYWLGLYLGDGSSNGSVVFTNPEPDLLRSFAGRLPESDETSDVARHGYCAALRVRRRVRGGRSETTRALDALGLSGLRSWEKFVPTAYLLAPVKDRLALLCGLCDTDGYVTDPNGACVEFSTTSPRLCDDVVFLIQSLGGRATFTCRESHYVKNGERFPAKHSYRLVLSFPDGAITPVKSLKHLAKWRGGAHPKNRERMIVAVDPIGRAECRCITVGRGLYVTDGFAVTHNSAAAFGILSHVSVHLRVPAALFTLEMNRDEVTQRLLAVEGMVEQQRIRNGTLRDGEDWQRLMRAAAVVEDAPIAIHDAAAVTIGEIRSKARRLKIREPRLGLIIVDYLQLLTSGKDEASRVQEVSAISRSLKVLAGELRVPVIALSQLSRQVEQRHDKRPLLSDLRESGAIEQDADLVLFLYRDDYYYEDTASPGVAELHIAKHRNGPTGTVKLTFVQRYARFSNLRLAGDAASVA